MIRRTRIRRSSLSLDIGAILLLLSVIVAFSFVGPFRATVSAQSSGKKVVIITHRETNLYKQTRESITTTLEKGPEKVLLKTIEYSGEDTIDAVKREDPDLIITLGTAMTKTISTAFPDVPVVFSAVLKPVKEGLDAPNVTGSLLNIPIKVQFELLQQVVPNLKTIGVLYNPDLNEDTIKEARTIAAKMKLDLNSRAVRDYREFSTLLTDWLTTIDAFWFIADDVICQVATIKHLMLQTLTMRKPAMGISAAFVQSGALCALSCDYADVGIQAGEIAIRVLQGESPTSIPPTEARKTLLYLNLTSAKSLGIVLPDSVVASAAGTF